MYHTIYCCVLKLLWLFFFTSRHNFQGNVRLNRKRGGRERIEKRLTTHEIFLGKNIINRHGVLCFCPCADFYPLRVLDGWWVAIIVIPPRLLRLLVAVLHVPSRGKELPDYFHRQNVIYTERIIKFLSPVWIFSLLQQSWKKFPLSLSLSLILFWSFKICPHYLSHEKGFFSFFTSPFTLYPLFWNNLSCEDDIGEGRPIDL